MDQPNYLESRHTAEAGAKTVNLALQGGGSHGAFTWGVLDRLLEEKGLAFEGIIGTSAGAVNDVVLADGLAAGGRQGAREALRVYWRKSIRVVISKSNAAYATQQSDGFPPCASARLCVPDLPCVALPAESVQLQPVQ